MNRIGKRWCPIGKPLTKTLSTHGIHLQNDKNSLESTALGEETSSLSSRSSVTFQAEMHIGPIASPHVLALYKKIDVSLVDRLVTMSERQSEHRRILESTVVHGKLAESKRGMYCGLTVALFGLCVCAFLGYLRLSTAATIVGCVDLTALVSLFIYAQKEPIPIRK